MNAAPTLAQLLTGGNTIAADPFGTALLAGANLASAKTRAQALTPYGLPLGPQNRALLVLPPGKYQLAAALDFGTDYLDCGPLAATPTGGGVVLVPSATGNLTISSAKGRIGGFGVYSGANRVQIVQAVRAGVYATNWCQCWPSNPNTVFDNSRGASGSASIPGNLGLQSTGTGSANDAWVVRKLAHAPGKIFHVIVEWRPTSSAAGQSGDVFWLNVRDSSGNSIAKVAATLGDQTTTPNSFCSVAFTANGGGSHTTPGFFTKTSSTDFELIRFEIHLNPATGMANYCLGHPNIFNDVDGTKSTECENRSPADLAYGGVPYDLELRTSITSGSNLSAQIQNFHHGENGYAWIGDSVVGDFQAGIGQQDHATFAPAAGLNVPFVAKGFGGRILGTAGGSDTTQLLNHYQQLTVAQGWKNVGMQIGTNDLGVAGATNNPGLQAQMQAAYTTILTWAAAQMDAGKLESFTVSNIPPRGYVVNSVVTNARDAATEAAAQAVNAWLLAQCQSLGLRYLDGWTILHDPASQNSGALYLSGYSADGTHPQYPALGPFANLLSPHATEQLLFSPA